jgi:hypothetical protein
VNAIPPARKAVRKITWCLAVGFANWYRPGDKFGLSHPTARERQVLVSVAYRKDSTHYQQGSFG